MSADRSTRLDQWVMEMETEALEARIARVEARPFFFPWGRCEPWTGQAPATYRLIGGTTDIPHRQKGE